MDTEKVIRDKGKAIRYVFWFNMGYGIWVIGKEIRVKR